VDVHPARLQDIPTYTAAARSAQGWLRSQGLGQYIPAAHEEYAASVRQWVLAGTLQVVTEAGSVIGFFNFDVTPAKWWLSDGPPAMYLAGMVLAEPSRGRGIGSEIVRWCVAETCRRGCQFLRLDCHADNPWLRAYYERQGFILRGLVDQHPGYRGCLYELPIDTRT
jgi:GNAT superfamily N-acetyltransferase